MVSFPPVSPPRPYTPPLLTHKRNFPHCIKMSAVCFLTNSLLALLKPMVIIYIYIYIYIYIHTGRFIMHFGITKFIVGKPHHTYLRNLYRYKEQLKIIFPSKLFFTAVHISAATRCGSMLWENVRSGGEVVLCVGTSHSKSVVTVQRAFHAQYLSHLCHVISPT